MNQRLLFSLSLSILFLLLFGCRINRTVNHERVGKWVYKDTVNGTLYTSKGRYKKSTEIKTWNYFENHKRIKKEKYQNGICYITTYNKQGKITAVGQSKMVDENNETHWYYFGEWKFFNEKQELIAIKKYEKGELISEVAIE
ncbi:hypothetical protein [Flavobacterium phycosphaerae]|uniref:hypothetical protein n=1 Tax=Flavobacterium phycosphaerae TaxID=2697515 RepID=UPI001389F103|nr:hypothetical protein [Flavobacterium phycosphaerae]